MWWIKNHSMSNCLTESLMSFKKHYFTFHFESENCIVTREMVLKSTQHVELFKRVCDEFKERIVLAFTFWIKNCIPTREMVLKSCYIHTHIHTHTQTDIPDSRPYPFSLGNCKAFFGTRSTWSNRLAIK